MRNQRILLAVFLLGHLWAFVPGCTAFPATCLKETTIKVAGRDMVFTLADAEKIKLIVDRYLAEERPKLEPSVFGPGDAFIDCRGTVRMGAWILESAYSDEPELGLAFRIFTSEHFIVRQVIGLRQENGEWKVAGVGRVTSHLRSE